MSAWARAMAGTQTETGPETLTGTETLAAETRETETEIETQSQIGAERWARDRDPLLALLPAVWMRSMNSLWLRALARGAQRDEMAETKTVRQAGIETGTIHVGATLPGRRAWDCPRPPLLRARRCVFASAPACVCVCVFTFRHSLQDKTVVIWTEDHATGVWKKARTLKFDTKVGSTLPPPNFSNFNFNALNSRARGTCRFGA